MRTGRFATRKPAARKTLDPPALPSLHPRDHPLPVRPVITLRLRLIAQLAIALRPDAFDRSTANSSTEHHSPHRGHFRLTGPRPSLSSTRRSTTCRSRCFCRQYGRQNRARPLFDSTGPPHSSHTLTTRATKSRSGQPASASRVRPCCSPCVPGPCKPTDPDHGGRGPTAFRGGSVGHTWRTRRHRRGRAEPTPCATSGAGRHSGARRSYPSHASGRDFFDCAGVTPRFAIL
jgi:hypothetical protein